MSMRRYRYPSLVIAAAFIVILPAALAVVADGEGFQCEFPITEGRQSLRTFTLTAEVYQCMLRGNYTDLSVVNASREPVPFRLISPEPVTDTNRYRRELPVYREPATVPYDTGEQIRKIAQLSDMVSQTETDAGWSLKKSFYSSLILRRDENEHELKSITIDTEASVMTVNTMLLIEESRDLQHWETLFGPYVLYILPGDKGELRNNTLELGTAGRARYLRIAMLSSIRNFAEKITGISGEYELSQQTPVEWQWLRPRNPEPTGEADTWEITLPGLFPVSRVRFIPADDMVYYEGALFVRDEPVEIADSDKLHPQGRKKVKRLMKEIVQGENPRLASNQEGAWRRVAPFTQYRLLTKDGSMSSPDIRIGPVQGRRWKLVFNPKSAVTRERLPQLEFGWQPLQAMFVAQGAGPFSLLAGREQAVPAAAFPAQLTGVNTEPQTVALSSTVPAATGEAPVTAAPQALFNWRTLVLWLILLSGLAGMATMAYRLARSMNKN
jgi:hypothetical protein